MLQQKIKNALISVYYKEGLDVIIRELDNLGVTLFATGGTQDFIEKMGIKVTAVENLTSYPSILGGRVKTLHPKIFGGILARRDNEEDKLQMKKYEIPEMDLIVVDLYPFEETLKKSILPEAETNESEIIEKIDIGGISLIRAGAKNHKDVLIIPSRSDYPFLLQLLKEKNGISKLSDRKKMACRAFHVTSHYDTTIFNYFNKEEGINVFKQNITEHKILRYGENPHQKGIFYGCLNAMFEQLNGKELSYNNLLDIDAAILLLHDFKETTFAVLKHNNACGIASRDTLPEAWGAALEADPVSAFGGVLITNRILDEQTAEEINKLFFEVLIAPGYENQALEILKQKKNRIILLQKPAELPSKQFRSILNGVVEQERDSKTDVAVEMKTVTLCLPSSAELSDMEFASKVVKHTKSNAIVLVKNKQLLASGTGQTSRVDALKQAIAKAQSFGFILQGAVMASDAFFPFPDCVEIACQAGISAVIQPGGSVKDNASIEYCNNNNMCMCFTGTRHFKH